jgi:hypothetical protein
VDVPAPKVHRVRQGVGQLRRHRPDLAPDAAEIREEMSPLCRELSQKGRKLQDVHGQF